MTPQSMKFKLFTMYCSDRWSRSLAHGQFHISERKDSWEGSLSKSNLLF